MKYWIYTLVILFVIFTFFACTDNEEIKQNNKKNTETRAIYYSYIELDDYFYPEYKIRIKKNSTNLGAFLIGGKKCYAIGEFDATDSLYNIFETIFENEHQLEEFLKKYNK